MSNWLLQLFVGSIGLVFTALLARGLLAAWKREPVASYRLLRVVLAVALVLPLLQLGVRGAHFPGGAWLSARLAALAPDEQRAEPTGTEAPSAFVTSADLEAIAFEYETLEYGTDEELALGPPLFALESDPAASTATVAGPRADSEAAAPVPASKGPASKGGGARLWTVLAAIYVAGVLLRLAWTGLRMLRTKRLLERARPVRDPAVLELWESLRRSTPLAARVELVSSDEIRVPMCSGLGRPVILLPRRGACAPSPDVLRCVLLHELVHLERRDGWVVLAQELLQAPFWFHPAARWLSRHLDLFRELSCDARVARRTGHPKRYAAALVEYAEWMQREIRTPHATSAALLPWTTTHGQLSRRIEMLLSRSTSRPAGARRFLVGGAFATLPFIWGSQLALASCVSHAQSAPHGQQSKESCEHCEPAVTAAPAVAPTPAPAPAPAPEPRELAAVRVAPPGTPVAPHEPMHPSTPAPRVYAYGQGGEPVVISQDGERLPLAVVTQDGHTPMIGVELDTIDDGEPTLRIQRVIPGSLAEQSGIEDGDVVIEVEGEPATLENLNIAKRQLPGGQILLEIDRDGERQEIVIDGHALQSHDKTHVWAVPRGAAGVPYEAMQEGNEAIARAREALERAVAAQPDNHALREALEALEQARSGMKVYRRVPHEGAVPAPEAPRMRLRVPSTPGMPPEPPRMKVEVWTPEKAEALGLDVRRRVEEARKARREYHEDHGEHAGGDHREQELQELRALLEERRRELEELRARLEELRSERSDESMR